MPALGALIYLRNLPSIVVTLGMSFVWQGLAILLLPKPGGKAPGWLLAIMGVKPPFIPFPIVAALIIAAVGYFGLMRTSYGAILRASGGNALAIERAGWSLLRAKMTLFALAGVFGVLSGMALLGITTSADANIGNGYTLLSIAGVILGGGEFVGGVVSPIGAVLGALTMAMAASPLLTFMHIPPDWQVGANGAILIIVLAARVAITRKARTDDGRLPDASQAAMDLVVRRRRRGLARGDRLHGRLRRRGHADGGAISGRLHGHCRRWPDVRDHARARQRRPLLARQHRARQRGGDEDDGRRRPAGPGRASPPRSPAGLRSASPIIS